MFRSLAALAAHAVAEAMSSGREGRLRRSVQKGRGAAGDETIAPPGGRLAALKSKGQSRGLAL